MQMPRPDSFTRHDTLAHAAGQPLSDLERRVVRLGRADAARGSPAGARLPALRRLFGSVTGIHHAQPLAEERLEKLRLYACAVHRGDACAPAIAAELRTLGFSADALGTAMALARR